MDDTEEIAVKNFKGKIRVSDRSKGYSLRRKSYRRSSFIKQLELESQTRGPKDRTDDEDEEVMATGLRNIGNSCYVNATLQALANTTPFTESLMRRRERRDADKGEGKKEELLEEVTSIIEKLKKGEAEYVTPTQVIETAKKLSAGNFGSGTQEDAHEFLMFLLEEIHEENKEGVSITEEIFTGEKENILECTSCKRERDGFPNPVKFKCRFIDIPTNQGEEITLEECIRHTNEEEKIEANCPYCKGKEAWRRNKTITKYPLCQIIQLKRFEKDGKKNKRIVQLPVELENMSLIAVIDHIGDSQRSGHYSTQCWNEFKQKWCLLDDMDTEEIDEDMRSTENTYVAIYSFVNETKELEKRKEEELRGNITKKRKEEKEEMTVTQSDDKMDQLDTSQEKEKDGESEATARESHINADVDDIVYYNEVESISFSPVELVALAPEDLILIYWHGPVSKLS